MGAALAQLTSSPASSPMTFCRWLNCGRLARETMSEAEGRSAGSTDQQNDIRSRKWVGSDRSCNITRSL